MAKKKDDKPKIVLERTFNIPLRKEFQKVPKYKRAKKAVTALRKYLQRHMKSDNIKLGKNLNELIWANGIKNPPHHVKVSAVKEDSGVIRAELVGKPIYIEEPEPADKKKKAKEEKAEEKIAEKKTEEKITEKKTEEKEQKKENIEPEPVAEKKPEMNKSEEKPEKKGKADDSKPAEEKKQSSAKEPEKTPDHAEKSLPREQPEKGGHGQKEAKESEEMPQEESSKEKPAAEDKLA